MSIEVEVEATKIIKNYKVIKDILFQQESAISANKLSLQI